MDLLNNGLLLYLILLHLRFHYILLHLHLRYLQILILLKILLRFLLLLYLLHCKEFQNELLHLLQQTTLQEILQLL